MNLKRYCFRLASLNFSSTFQTPLHKAVLNPKARKMIMQLLLKNQAEVNAQTSRGETGLPMDPYITKHKTALHYAVREQRMDLLKILLHAGADINIAETREGKTVLEIAVGDKFEKVRALLTKVKGNKKFPRNFLSHKQQK